MDERLKKAFDFSADLTKQLISLATGIIALTITFSKDFIKNAPASAHPYAFWSWYCFIGSIAMGILTLSALTGNLDAKDQSEPPTVFAPNIVVFSVAQFLMFAAGLALTIAFGVASQ